ncbi:MAG: hypothetical protein AB1861_09490 [Cyanobacteriota bacterium]
MSLVFGCSTEQSKTSVNTSYEEKTSSAPKPAPEPAPPQQPSGISWNEARYHIGERTTVYGPVASTYWATGSKGQPTFINLGNAYPNTNRFTAIIWVQNRGNFSFAPESYYGGKTISVTGLIVDYEGVPEIEVTSPSQIQVW